MKLNICVRDLKYTTAGEDYLSTSIRRRVENICSQINGGNVLAVNMQETKFSTYKSLHNCQKLAYLKGSVCRFKQINCRIITFFRKKNGKHKHFLH